MSTPLSRLCARHSLSLVAIAGAALSAFGQNFNIDVGDDPTGAFGGPAVTYPGAAAMPGFWNRLQDGAPGVNLPPPIANPWYVNDVTASPTLKDITGAASTVTHSCAMAPATNNSLGDYEFNNGATVTDDQALYDDQADCGLAGGAGVTTATWTFSNLQNGAYTIYSYAWGSDNTTYITKVTVTGSTDLPQNAGGAWPGGHLLGQTYTKHNVTITNNTLVVIFESVAGYGSCNGIQIKQNSGGPGTAFCVPGVSGVIACACGNPNGAGKGCANTGSSGATLAATGTASLAADATDPGSVQLTGTSMLSGSSCIFLQGDALAAAGAGVTFGAGIRCTGGQLFRLYTKTGLNVAGGTMTGPVAGDRSISNRSSDLGTAITNGATRYYQIYYRDPGQANPGGSCPANDTFNITHALSIVWGP